MFNATFKNTIWSTDRDFTRIADASDLGITAKEISVNGWPMKIGDPEKIGNGLDFYPYAKKVVDGELIHVRYTQSAGCISLIIFND